MEHHAREHIVAIGEDDALTSTDSPGVRWIGNRPASTCGWTCSTTTRPCQGLGKRADSVGLGGSSGVGLAGMGTVLSVAGDIGSGIRVVSLQADMARGRWSLAGTNRQSSIVNLHSALVPV